MKNFFNHLRIYIFRGLLAIIPILLCVVAIRLLYVLIDQKIMSILRKFVDISFIPGFGILLLLFCLYMIGLIVSNIMGRQIFKFIENISERIPFIKFIYGVGKQLSHGLSLTEGQSQAFKKALFVRMNDGVWAPAFLMNSVVDPQTKEELWFVLIPTSPTPGSGFVCLVKPSQTFDPGWTVEECLKSIVSIGIIIPSQLVNEGKTFTKLTNSNST